MDWSEIPGWYTWEKFYDNQVSLLPAEATVVEIGVFLGRSIIHLAQTAKHLNKNLKIYAVDTFSGSPGSIDEKVYSGVLEKYGGSFEVAFRRHLTNCGVSTIVHVLSMPSTEAAKTFPDKSIDLVFIDGDHSEAAVKSDVVSWLPKLSATGIMAGHDINTYPSVGVALNSVLGVNGYTVDTQNIWIKSNAS